MELVQTKQTDDGKLYLCPTDGWVEGQVWSETGYRKLICPHCGTELDTDPFGDLEHENQAEDDPDATKPLNK